MESTALSFLEILSQYFDYSFTTFLVATFGICIWTLCSPVKGKVQPTIQELVEPPYNLKQLFTV